MSLVGSDESDTIAAYDAFAAEYADGTAARPAAVVSVIARFVAALRPGGRVLEIGSGPGYDALELEEAGLSVRRTDVTPAFVRMLRRAGHEADVLDPLVDDLDDPANPGERYDAVWADACLLHVSRDNLPVVLTRLAAATRIDGLLCASFKEGDGDGWSVHGHVRARRHFTYWRSEGLRAILDDAGWTVDEVGREEGGSGDIWLEVWARRR
jgi:SAM-dependent methyltransferase